MLTFMAGCLAGRPYRELVEAAGEAGFRAITLWPNVLRHARTREGLSLRDMRALLDDNGLVLADLEGCAQWRPGAGAPVGKGLARDKFLEACAVLGARCLGAIHPPGEPLDETRAAEDFAALCDDAAKLGVRVALEFIAMSAVSDAATAARIVEAAGRDNGGLVIDSWHHVRGAARGDAAAFDKVRGARVFTIQLSDGPSRCALALEEETMFHRLLPGQGEMNVAGLLEMLIGKGVRAHWGPEVYQPAFEGQATLDIMRSLITATVAVLPPCAIDALSVEAKR